MRFQDATTEDNSKLSGCYSVVISKSAVLKEKLMSDIVNFVQVLNCSMVKLYKMFG